MLDILEYIAWSNATISLLIATITLSRINRLSRYLKYFGYWLISGAVIELASTTLAHFSFNNLFFFHVNSLLEFVILTCFFDSLFSEIGIKGVKKIIYPGILLILINSIFFQSISVFNSYALVGVSIYLMTISLVYFKKLADLEVTLDEKMLRVIFVGAVFVTQACNLIPSIFGNYLITIDSNVQALIWVLRACIMLVVKIILVYVLMSVFFHKQFLNR